MFMGDNMINLYYLIKCLECGHFCIRYLLKKDNIKPNVVYDKQLMSLGLVKRVLKEYYLDVEWYVASDIKEIKDKFRFITLIKIRENCYHYIVVEKIDSDSIYYYNPLYIGLKRSKISKFMKKWSHYCCFFEKK